MGSFGRTEWCRLLDDAIDWLPGPIRDEIEYESDSSQWSDPVEASSFLKIILCIKEADLSMAMSLIERVYETSEYAGALFLLRARVHFLQGEYEDMMSCLKHAADLNEDPVQVEQTTAELAALLNRLAGQREGLESDVELNADCLVEPIDEGQIQIDSTSGKGSCIAQDHVGDKPFFEVVVTGLRLGEFFEECLESISQQSYRQFRVHVLSDMDSENTIGAASETLSRFHFPCEPVVKTVPVRVGKAALIYDHLIDFKFNKNSVAVILDGDDRFASEEALKIFAKKYQSENPDACWSTYIRSDGVLGHSAPLIKGFDHRRQGWKSSHCFTFRAGLIKHVPRSYILDEVGNPVMQACDIALALPILDLAKRTSFIPEALYYYEVSNPESHHNQSDGVGLTSKRQMETAKYLYGKTPLISPN